jgi:hypothetical protein
MKISKSKTVSKSQLSEVRHLHQDIISAARMSLKKAIRIGQLLNLIKNRLGHGQWLPWAEKHLPFAIRTAQNYLRVYDSRAQIKNATVAHLGTAYRLLAPTLPAKTTTKAGDSSGKSKEPPSASNGSEQRDSAGPEVAVASEVTVSGTEPTPAPSPNPGQTMIAQSPEFGLAVYSYRMATRIVMSLLFGTGTRAILPRSEKRLASLQFATYTSCTLSEALTARLHLPLWDLHYCSLACDIAAIVSVAKYAGGALSEGLEGVREHGVFAPEGDIRKSAFYGRELSAEEKDLLGCDPFEKASDWIHENGEGHSIPKEALMHYLACVEVTLRDLLALPEIDKAIQLLAAELIAWWTTRATKPFPGNKAMRIIGKSLAPFLVSKETKRTDQAEDFRESEQASPQQQKPPAISAQSRPVELCFKELEAAMERTLNDSIKVIQQACGECERQPKPDPAAAIEVARQQSTTLRRFATRSRRQFSQEFRRSKDGQRIEMLFRYWETEIDSLKHLVGAAMNRWAYAKDKGPKEIHLDPDELPKAATHEEKVAAQAAKLTQEVAEAADGALEILRGF